MADSVNDLARIRPAPPSPASSKAWPTRRGWCRRRRSPGPPTSRWWSTRLATGEQGAAAALSHTGSLAGSDAAYRAAFGRAGVVMVDEFRRAAGNRGFLAKAPPCRAPGIAVVSTSGGAAIMAADKAEVHGVPLPQPGRGEGGAGCAHPGIRLRPQSRSTSPRRCSNDPESLRACAERSAPTPPTARWCCRTAMPTTSPAPRFALLEPRREHGKTACVVWLTEWLEGPGAEAAEANPQVARVPLHGPLLRGAGGLAGAGDAARRRARARRHGCRHRRPRRRPRRCSAAGSTTLTEREAKAVLAAYGVPVVGERLVGDPKAGSRRGRGARLPGGAEGRIARHPAQDRGGRHPARPGRRGGGARRLPAVMANAAKVAPSARINGVLVQPMVPQGHRDRGRRARDPLFGPLVVVGLGGIFVELLQGHARRHWRRSARRGARACCARLKGARCWKASADAGGDRALVGVIRRVSELRRRSARPHRRDRRQPADLRRRSHDRGGWADCCFG